MQLTCCSWWWRLPVLSFSSACPAWGARPAPWTGSGAPPWSYRSSLCDHQRNRSHTPSGSPRSSSCFPTTSKGRGYYGNNNWRQDWWDELSLPRHSWGHYLTEWQQGKIVALQKQRQWLLVFITRVFLQHPKGGDIMEIVIDNKNDGTNYHCQSIRGATILQGGGKAR